MNLLLFETARGELFPVTEPLHSPIRPHPPAGRWEKLKEEIRRGYERLAERLNHLERSCAALRHAQHLDVYHPAAWDQQTAEKRLRELLKIRYSKHSRWFWIDMVLAFLGIFLFFVPGPNVFFFYPAIRTLGHYFARNGARNALELRHVAYQTEPLIDQVQSLREDLERASETVLELQERYRLRDLSPVLAQLGEK